MTEYPNTPVEGAILDGPHWPEAVRVLSVKIRSNRLEIHAIGINTRQHYAKLIGIDEFNKTVKVSLPYERALLDGNPDHFRLAAEAHRIRLAYQYDPHFAVSVSQVDPLPHQLDAVYSRLLTQPRIRFLVADDPGAGKTIMAGLLLKEMKLRGLIERVLIVTPANLTDQWRRLQQAYGDWMKQMAKNLTDPLSGFIKDKLYLIHDRDPLYTEEFRNMLESSGIKTMRTPPMAPNLTPIIERFIRSIKSECLGRMLVFGEDHLRYCIEQYCLHYHQERPHQGIGNNMIEPPPQGSGEIACHATHRRAFEIIQEGGLMGGMNIFTVLVTGWLPEPDRVEGGVGPEFMSGYRGVTFGNGLTGKELCDLAVLKK